MKTAEKVDLDYWLAVRATLEAEDRLEEARKKYYACLEVERAAFEACVKSTK